MVQKYKRVNYFDKYNCIMQFNKNKNTYIHGWYPFVEGYSKSFIKTILNELDFMPETCLDPFAGSGTTPFELQKHKIKCYSFEVNPFMQFLSKTKMCIEYQLNDFIKHFDDLKYSLENYIEEIESIIKIPEYRTIVEKEGLEKWNFNRDVMLGLLDIKYAINQINDIVYKNLFQIAFASILLQVSNLYRNGKCLSYKKNLEQMKKITRRKVHQIFVGKVEKIILPDIKKISTYKSKETLFSNANHCFLGDVRNKISIVNNNEIDLIITSPPYLNSRDYTDSYMLELRMLDFFNNTKEIANLRKKTIRSHVQVQWKIEKSLNIPQLSNSIKKINMQKDKFWNKGIIDMINGYFLDMDILFKSFSRILSNKGKIYFNVANSAYYGEEIKVDEIIAEIAENNGLKVVEIREARKINPSSQQRKEIPYLIESVILITK